MHTLKKYLALALAVLLCLSVLWGCGKKASQEEQDSNDPDLQQDQQQVQDETPVILSDTIECSDGNRTLRFQKNESGKWEWRDDPEFPLDETYVNELLTTFETMLTLQPITTEETLKSLKLEEDNTAKYITASNEKGEKLTWYLGKKNDNGSYYMRLEDDKTFAIFLSPAGLSDQISRSIYDMMVLPALPQIIEESIQSVTVKAGKEEEQLLQKDNDGRWFSPSNNLTLQLRTLIHSLGETGLDACVDFKPSSSAPGICGLNPAAVTATICYRDATDTDCTFTLSVGNPRGDGYCVTINDDSTIYLLNATAAKAALAFAS